MQIEVQCTRQDYIYYYRDYFFVRTLVVRIVAAFFACSIVLNIKGAPLWPGLSIAAVLLFAIFPAPYLIAVRNAVKKPGALAKRIIAFREDGFSVDSDYEHDFRGYDAIKDIEMNNKHMFITLFNSGLYLIPKRDFANENEAVNFYQLVRKTITASSAKDIEKRSKHKSMYGWRWICIIPLVGGIAGIIYIIRGLTEFKDRKLVITGIAGLLFTTLIYSFVYSLTTLPAFKNNFVRMAQNNLNSLAPQIEFYKIQNGTYPDSLEQLGKDRIAPDCVDPFLHGSRYTKNFLHYNKTGNKYTLFSVGIDGIPYTKDDIYPNIAIKDTGKYGLVKVNQGK